MKKFLCVCLTLGLLVSLLPSSLAWGGITMYIKPLQDYNFRVKLREYPTTNSRILGQYYAGTDVFVLEYNAIYHGDELEDWARVTIGGLTGYMMNEYLVYSSDEGTIGEVFPLHGEEAVLLDKDGVEIDTLPAGEIQVLGTTEYDTVHVTAEKDGLIEYGYLYADEVLWTGERQKARVRAIKSADSVPVRTEPNLGGRVLCSLYPGTEVKILFSNELATSGWTRIRIDNVTGYVPDPYLDHSTDIFPFYRPQPAQLKIPVAPVYGGTAKTVSQLNLLFILGKRNSTTPEYLVLFGVWDPELSEYQLHTGFVPQNFVILKAPGGVPARGLLKKSSYIYQFNSNGEMVPIIDRRRNPVLYPMGSEFYIAYGLDEDQNTIEGPLTGYITRDTAWVYVELRVPEKYKGVQGYLPLDVVKYDQRLMLPGNVTGNR